ncbi:hypothetical protein LV475_05570 [Guyparkeria hydrothermalis]|uniref:hypothetical protein n=1 Tax=Guyparkeria hydrothermalis TaxID=923 RepID=UPI0020200DD3|nr:hypothetical protein [Guyparkeria hydrothermalis]MCL7751062.1 hypothetical protein [Guyparkeria hydrothermalis]
MEQANNSPMKDSCEDLRLYAVPHAAALWCGVPPEKVDEVLAAAQPLGEQTARAKATLTHPAYPCLEARISAMHNAIDEDELAATREDGRPTRGSGVADSRRHVRGTALREWARQFRREERPSFLFTEADHEESDAVRLKVHQALKAERDRLRQDLADSRKELEEHQKMISSLEADAEHRREGGESELVRLRRVLGALCLGVAASNPKWRAGEQPNISQMTSAAQKAVADIDGSLPHGYGKSTMMSALKEAIALVERDR